LKFFLLKVDPQKRMLFNPEESIDLQGDTGPFVQYTFARIKSMFRAADSAELNAKANVFEAKESELALMKVLMNYQSVVMKASQSYSPSLIVSYALDVAKAFNRVYNDVSFLREPDVNIRKHRLRLAAVTAETIHQLMMMLGIECPERM
ncbi:MAG TPA: DALR anticodon-binding domain-containing protein, partial [Bacteroidia bacterium]